MNLKTYYAFAKSDPLNTVAQIIKQRGSEPAPSHPDWVYYTKAEFEKISEKLRAQHLAIQGFRFSPVRNEWVYVSDSTRTHADERAYLRNSMENKDLEW